MTRFSAGALIQNRALIRDGASTFLGLRNKTLESQNRGRAPFYELELAIVYDHGSFWQSLDLDFEACL